MKHKVNFPKNSLIVGTCICCHRRNDHIVIGDGRCTDCIYDGNSNEHKLTKFQRDYFIASFSAFVGMIIVFIIQRELDWPIHPMVNQMIFLFALVSIAIMATMYIYNTIKKS